MASEAKDKVWRRTANVGGLGDLEIVEWVIRSDLS
jgi:hypothetical protein